jgi:hypothetical protein
MILNLPPEPIDHHTVIIYRVDLAQLVPSFATYPLYLLRKHTLARSSLGRRTCRYGCPIY